jgi:hypothetical protein
MCERIVIFTKKATIFRANKGLAYFNPMPILGCLDFPIK